MTVKMRFKLFLTKKLLKMKGRLALNKRLKKARTVQKATVRTCSIALDARKA